MPRKVAEEKPKNVCADLFGMSDAARLIGRSAPTCRSYARALRERGVAGILRASNGDYLVTPEQGLQALRTEAATRAARKPGG